MPDWIRMIMILTKGVKGINNRNHLIYKITAVSLFCITLLFSLILIISHVDISVALRTGIFIISALLVAVIGAVLLRSTKIRKFWILYVLSSVMLVFILGNLGHILAKMNAVERYQGNNMYNSFYEQSIGDSGYNSIKEGISNTINMQYGEEAFKEVYCVTKENYIWSFQKITSGLVSLQFYKEGDQYYLLGGTLLAYNSTINTSEYSDVETIRADAVHSLFQGIKETDISNPVWGVSKYNDIANVTINGIKMDYVEEIADSNGTVYYFWIIDDIGVMEEGKEFLIEGV